MTSASEQFMITDAFPTDAFSWMMATCSKQLRECLAVRFVNAGYSVTPEQWAILGHLFLRDGLSQQALADRFHRSKVAAFQLISKLEKQGLVVRRPDPEDGRSNLIYLTSEGRAVQSELIALAQQNMAWALTGVSEADLEVAKRVVGRIISNTKG
jgi:DNA-binding MarR family transcriptional regulator